MILSCGAENCAWPSRFAGTCSAYSGSAINQLTRITPHIAADLYFELKCPYQAIVMNMLEHNSSSTVRMADRPGLRDVNRWAAAAMSMVLGPPVRGFQFGKSA